jgi:hypothetical protein
MTKVAVLLLADTRGHGDLGRAANAFTTVRELKDGGDEVKLILDGAGTKWLAALNGSDHKLRPAYEAVRDRLAGVCRYCAGAFGATDAAVKEGVPLLADYDGHPSVKQLLDEGYQIITF